MNKMYLGFAALCVLGVLAFFIFPVPQFLDSGPSSDPVETNSSGGKKEPPVDSYSPIEQRNSRQGLTPSARQSSDNQPTAQVMEKMPPSLEGMVRLVVNSNEPSEIFRMVRTACFSADNMVLRALYKAWNAIHARDDDPLLNERREALLVGFALIGDKESLPLAEGIFNDKTLDPKTRMYALQAIASLGGEASLEFAMSYTGADDPTLKSRAIEAIGLIGDETAITELEKIAEDDELIFQRAAKVSLIQIRAARMAGSDKVTYIREQLKVNPRSVPLITWGVHTLKALNTPEALEALIALADPGEDSPGFLNKLSSRAMQER